jgi:hypothetical protein
MAKDEYVVPEWCKLKFDNHSKQLENLAVKVDELDKTVRNGISQRLASTHAHVKAQWVILGMIFAGVLGLLIKMVFEK